MAKLMFAPIDCKDCELIGLEDANRYYNGRPADPINMRLIAQAQKEYCEKLYQLQQEIQQKYGEQMVKEDPNANIDGHLQTEIYKEVYGDDKDFRYRGKYDRLYYT